MTSQILSFQQWQKTDFSEQATIYLTLSQTYKEWLRENPQGYISSDKSRLVKPMAK